MARYLICTLILSTCFPLCAGSPDALLGVWLTKKGDTIEIYRCDDHYCGRILDIVETHYVATDPMAGKVKVDRENPDVAKRERPIIGLQIMEGFRYAEKDDLWLGGTIYDPENGKTYKCKITLTEGMLRVRGYIGIPTIGRTELWKRQ